MLIVVLAIAMILLSLLLQAWVLALVARAVGSSRGQFRMGILAVVLICLLNIAILIALAPMGSLKLLLVVPQYAGIFYIVQSVFRLSAKHTWAPFFAFIGVGILVLAVALLVVRPYILEAFSMPAAGMSPTLEVGDRIVFSKLNRPHRWNIVAFRSSNPEHDVYCQRIIGLPGERLRFENGMLMINDQPIAAPAVLAGHFHMSIPDFENLKYRDGQTITLGSHDYFFIGDNIDHSYDSRFVGPSDGSTIVGVGEFIYWPANHVQLLH